uniref:NADH-ubiquinone oxidoreductase chain 4 n=2 Tax=Orbicella TaxID=1920453 RepID=Q4G6B4_ORBFA|nr:NADH dehydrogenase subunit 4 [Orbicella franksi]BAE16222.1 NADH dehydrogenase subunit 4 [Orbicella franksi]BAE16248.1 NADH dehydrogenase subunit 4 [Orbicella faveolata]
MSLFWLILLVGTISVMGVSREKKSLLKKRALEWSLAILFSALVSWGGFDGEGHFQFLELVEWGSFLAWGPLPFALDGVSLFFLLLTTFLIPVCILISPKSTKFLFKEFLLCLFFLEILLVGVFLVFDLFLFYIFFEGVLIPMFFLIGIWGSREEKVRASFYFFFFTFAGSVFFFFVILFLYQSTGTTNYILLLNTKLSLSVQKWALVGVFLSFAVKLPLVPFHIWLPQAHVEAPVAGSVILAGILLKLGGYGLLRFSWPLFPEASFYWSPVIVCFSVIAVVYGGLMTCRQIDFKRLVAYSSVAHMGLVPLGIFTHIMEGLVGAVFLMLAHGFVSSALFIGVTFLYDRHHTRLIKYYRGLTLTMPLFAVSMLVLSLSNMGLPLSCNFVGEFFSLLAAFKYYYGVGALVVFGVLFSAIYSLSLFNRTSFGGGSNYLLFNRDLNRQEGFTMFPFLIIIFLGGVVPFFVINLVKNSLVFSPIG